MLLEKLKNLTDPRSYHGREYLVHHIVYFTIIALLCNAKTYTDVGRFIKGHFDDLKRIFHLKWRHAPDPSAIRKILVALDPEEMEHIFQKEALTLMQHAENPNVEAVVQHICFDGKSLRGSFSHTKNHSAKGFFSAFATQEKIVLAHIPLASDKGCEIKALQEFFQKLPLQNVLVTADAVHCQKKHLNTQNRRA